MELSNDVVMEILSRLPLAEFRKATTLSKYYAEASHQWFFKELAAQHGTFLDGFVFQEFNSNNYKFYFVSPYSPSFDFSFDFVPGDRPKILATAANGLVLVQTSQPDQYHEPIYSICKPSTNQCKSIPLPRIHLTPKSMALFVLRSNPLHFKILQLSSITLSFDGLMDYSYNKCELFDSEIWRWKSLHDIGRDSNYGYLDSSNVTPVFAFASAHWIVSHGKYIYAFDFYSETWSTISMPIAIVEEYYKDINESCTIAKWHTKLVEYKGKLGLMRKFGKRTTGSTELWVMDNYRNKTWSKRKELLESMPMCFYGSDISVTLTFDGVIFSNLETKNWSSIKFGTRSDEESRIKSFSFITDFEPWNFHPQPQTLNPQTKFGLILNNVHSTFIFFLCCFSAIVIIIICLLWI